MRNHLLDAHYVLQLLHSLFDLLHFPLQFLVVLAEPVEDVLDGLVFEQVRTLPNGYFLPQFLDLALQFSFNLGHGPFQILFP